MMVGVRGVGRHLDLHCTAQGKALIASLGDEELEKLLAGRELAQFTPRTIRSLSALKAHLAEVRTNGFAVNDQEHVHGVRAVAAPVVDSPGAVIAAISVRGSTRPDFQLPLAGAGWGDDSRVSGCDFAAFRSLSAIRLLPPMSLRLNFFEQTSI